MRVIPFLVGLTLALVAPLAQAQGSFEPVITVNGRVITGYELDQRVLFLDILRVPGDHLAEAERGLIEDRLRLEAAKRDGITVTPAQLTAGMEEFASRANLPLDQFLEAIGQGGIAPETYRDFVHAGLLWREVVRARFAPRVVVTDAEIARATSVEQGRGAGPRVMISEILLPTSPATFLDQRDLAEELSKTATSDGAFAAAAREHSAAPSRDNGGLVGWIPVTNLPPQLRPVVMQMRPGQVSPPLPVPNAIALVRLRAIDQGGPVDPADITVDYLQYLVPGAGTPEAAAEVDRARAAAQSCGELFEYARKMPSDRLVRETRALTQVPADVAGVLADMDENEISTALRRGDTQVLLMLCDRNAYTAIGTAEIPVTAAAPAEGETRPAVDKDLGFGRGPSADTMRSEIVDQRLGALANAYLAELRAEAVITRP
ncbi:peptidylprolyl isomerase [Albidovulum sp.]|uniref:peptidylprolyl isomerase n=1 Tax=Albidovulum sp. TaxID=1872424 RepID=UPI001DF86AAD|nr:peptidylprolyl isomerase [Paracoccaceae bacterium]MCC0046315.1 peptidylprolyl isomerase [Defluviimonas sp.]HPE25786.1 peptidylprolyl isomerase [Albidovulum sp.]MCB2122528.1 peptidylprolyl isomerase [Paracoccaceae bacterium]MCB2140900.1 peptidylprolyl isomerase [Paracoccaceae bacterium]